MDNEKGDIRSVESATMYRIRSRRYWLVQCEFCGYEPHGDDLDEFRTAYECFYCPSCGAYCKLQGANGEELVGEWSRKNREKYLRMA